MDSKTENAMTIAAKLGVGTDDALHMLQRTIHIHSPADKSAGQVPQRTSALLARTFDRVKLVDAPSADADLTVYWGEAGREPGLVACRVDADLLLGRQTTGQFHVADLGVGQQTIAACYIAGAVTRMLIPDIADDQSEPMRIPLHQFAVCVGTGEIDIGDTYLVGAGAIGNGFVWALEPNVLTGKLTILDKDRVKDGNLQRNILNDSRDLGRHKVSALARYLAKSQPALNVDPQPSRTETVFKELGDALRIERLISAVDSPRARRTLQGWLPREVFDASTSGIQEVVFHHNRHPLHYACLECVYPFTPDEQAHEKHVADSLGVTIGALAEGLISEQQADIIIAKYPDIPRSQVVGEAYDSLFKRLCGAERLRVASGSRVLAPLAFVSVLAGTLLAVEFQNRLCSANQPGFNYWRLSPWSPPISRLRRLLPQNRDCRFCSCPLNTEMMRKLWD